MIFSRFPFFIFLFYFFFLTLFFILPYFEHFIQDNFKDLANYEVVKELGVRDNRYSNVVGAIKYYNSRLKLRNVEISIFDLEQQEELGGTSKKVNISENSLLGKIYGYFFDN